MILHMLTEPATRVWLISLPARRMMADRFAKHYNAPVGICSCTMLLIAMVERSGAIRELPPPHKRYPIHQIANAPRPHECPCASFWDPEILGPWRDRGKDEHHPLCQYDKHAISTYSHVQRLSEQRHREGLSPHERPDDWTRTRQLYRGK